MQRELTQKTIDSDALREKILDLIPIGVYSCDAEGNITFSNQRAQELWGIKPELHKHIQKFCGFYKIWLFDGTFIPPEKTPLAVALQEGRSVRNFEAIAEKLDGTRLNIIFNVDLIIGEEGEILGAINSFQGVSSQIKDQKETQEKIQKRSQRIQLFSDAFAQLLNSTDPDAIIRELFSKVTIHLSVDAYFYFRVNETENALFLHSYTGIPKEIAQEIHRMEFGQGICGTVAKTRQPIVVNDIQNIRDEKTKIIKSLGIQTYACHPLMVGEQLLGTLSFGSRKRASFDREELEFLYVISQYTAIALERLQTTKTLRENEEKFRMLANGIPQLAWMADKTGKRYWFNQRWYDYTGMDLEESKGWGWKKAHHADYVEQTEKKYLDCFQNSVLWEDTYPLKAKAGTYGWFLSRAFPLRDTEGNIMMWFGTNTDITDLRNAQDALNEANNRLEQRVSERTAELAQMNAKFQAMFDQGVFTGMMTTDGILIDANRSSLEKCGFTREEVIGKPFWDTGWWNRSSAVQVWLKKGFAQALAGKDFHGETIYFTSDGSQRNVDFAFIPIKNETGQVLFVVPTGMDITERKQAEEQFRNTEILRESEERFRYMADNAPMMVWMMDKQGQLSFISKSWYDFTGISVEKNLNSAWKSAIHPEDYEILNSKFNQARESHDSVNLEYRLRYKDGEYRWMMNIATPRFSKNREFIGYVGSLIDITERRQAEKNSRRLAAIVQSSEDAIISKDMNGIITSWNPAAERLFGYSADEAIGQSILMLIPPDHISEEPEILKKIRQGKQIKHYETLRQRKDGSLRNISLTVSPIKDSKGKIIGASKIARDITERKKIESALQESEERFRLAIDAGKIGTWDWDISKNHVQWSPQTYQFHGLKIGEFEGRGESFTELVHPLDRERVQKAIQHSLKTLSPYSLEMRIIRPSGEVRWIATNGRVMVNSQGQPVRMLGATIDITEQRNTQEMLKEQSRSLEIINEVGSAIAAELNLDKLIQAVTDAAREICGAEFGAFFYNVKNENDEYYKIYTLSGPSKDKFEKLAKSLISSFMNQTFKAQEVIRIEDISKDARCREMKSDWKMSIDKLPIKSYMAIPVVSRSGLVLGGLFFGHSQPHVFSRKSEEIIVGIAAQAAISIDNAHLYEEVQNDLEKHKRMEEELSRSNHELEQFAYIASHDLQEPLHMITSFSDLMNRRCEKKLEEKEKEYLNFIRQGALQAKTLIRDLLEYSRMGRDKNFQTLDFNEILTEVLSILKTSIHESKATIKYETLPKIKASRLEMIQLFQNLISNALKYRAKKAPRISISAKKQKGKWMFSIKDNGIGIDPQYKERIFLMFQRLHGKGEYSGTGIGLATCKKIVAHHHGEIGVESKLGKGSTFYFTISVKNQ